MDCGDLLPMINPDSSIPELINYIRRSFRQCQFDEVQNILMNREKSMKDEKEILVRECESLKKELDSLEITQSLTALDKCSVEEELERIRKREEELNNLILQKGQMIEKLENDNLESEKKLVHSSTKCKEMDERVVKMVKEIEEMRRANLFANKDVEEMKAKGIEADRTVQELKRQNGEAAQTIQELKRQNGEAAQTIQELKLQNGDAAQTIQELKRKNGEAAPTIEELKRQNREAAQTIQELKRKNGEAAQTIDELRAQKMEIEMAAEEYRSDANDLNRRISMLESALAQMLSVDVKDLASLANNVGKISASATHNEVDNNLENGQLNSDAEERVIVSPEVPAVSDVRDVAHSGTEEDDTNGACTNQGSEPASSNSAVAESDAIVQNNEAEEPVVGGEVAGNAVIVISDSDSDDENMPSKKRDRREGEDDSDIYCSIKRRRESSAQPSGLPSSSNVEERQMWCTYTDAVDLVESEDESCSDSLMNDLVANFKSSG